MQATLRDNLASGTYHVAQNRLLRDLGSRTYSGTDGMGNTLRIELSPANSVWADRTLLLGKPFLDVLGQQYDSGVMRVSFLEQAEAARLAINGWVEAKTHDRIQDLLLPADVTAATRVVVVNALYFYGSWLTLFDESLTRPAVFHTLAGSDVEVPSMRQSMSREYKATASLEVLKLPYVQGKLWMTLVLPQAGEFAATRSQISGPWLSEITTGMTATDIALSLPKFKLETGQLKLREPLTDMGMGIAFSGQADFSGITTEAVSIGQVIQKAFIGVDEAGTEAAAATAVTMPGGNPTPTPFIVDRPFLFFVQDATGLVLFSGQVVDPTQ
jgi:serpin B